MPQRIDLVGRTFGKLVVLSPAADRKNYRTYWHCQCECGTLKEIRTAHLVAGLTASCGCASIERNRARATHGMTDSALYNVWSKMKSRCSNPNDNNYARYGGRGISVCESWASSFDRFMQDMGAKPFGSAEIDRINNDGNYGLTNCRWSTPSGNGRNKRNNVYATIGGETKLLIEWAEQVGIGIMKVRLRMSRGWTAERALGLDYKDLM